MVSNGKAHFLMIEREEAFYFFWSGAKKQFCGLYQLQYYIKKCDKKSDKICEKKRDFENVVKSEVKSENFGEVSSEVTDILLLLPFLSYRVGWRVTLPLFSPSFFFNRTNILLLLPLSIPPLPTFQRRNII